VATIYPNPQEKKIMEKVVSGIVRFKGQPFQARRELFAELAGGQSPEVLFITCADSRIDPNLVTQTEPGDLFICRNAGNIVPPHVRTAGGMTASIEFAVAVLGVKDIVVCGHTDCGAMKGAMNPASVESLPHVRDWLDHSRAAVEIAKAKCGHETDVDLRKVTEENVMLQLQHLKTHPAVASRVAAGDIGLHGWVYDIENGEVSCHDPDHDAFVPMEERYASLLAAAESQRLAV
jgi:carbonic anhydrase